MGYNGAKKKMKKVLRLSLMAALVIMMCLSSCTKPEKQIVGKWKITYAKEDGYNDKNAVGEIWTFKENGTFNGYLVDLGDVTAKWSIDGNELTIKGGDLEYSESGSGWTDTEEMVYTLDIEQLDKNNLVVSGKVKLKEEYWEAGDGTETYTETWNADYELVAK